MIKSGINQIGGKFRLRKVLEKNTPYHEYFLSLFLGSGIYELNKPKPFHYECFNDANPRIANYFIVIKLFREEFEKRRQNGPFVLNCRYLYDLLNKGVLTPKDMIEDAIHFHYQIKLSFGSQLQYRGLVPETTSKKKFISAAKESYLQKLEGIEYKGHFKSNLGKTTRPITNNDCGILTEINQKVSERLKYVVVESLDFRKVYNSFHRAYHKKKGLGPEVFIYADPPYPGTEHYYSGLFQPEDHEDLINLMLESPFKFMLSIGGDCQFYLDAFKGPNWIIKEVYTKYSTNANSQELKKEYLIMNYDIKAVPRFEQDNQSNLSKYITMEG